MPGKVIVTNGRRLRRKYTASGADRVLQAVERLRRADARRGISTQLVDLGDRAQMEALGGKPVTRYRDGRANKAAVDAVCTALAPDYLVLLGAPDVLPHQSLRNPVTDDEDPDVPSDLPYACTAPFSRAAEDFLAPTRVVGRIPNVCGDDDPDYLIRLLLHARRWASRSGYDRGFVLSAWAWRASSRQSARSLFGTQRGVETSPESSFPWAKSLLGRRVHFINCHGADTYPFFYGDDDHPDEDEREYPEAHWSERLQGVKEGSVVAAECCYGASLYDPTEAGADEAICNAYLRRGAAGFFGSTTIAYGPAEGNGQADDICRYFLRRVQRGASLGRATLEARQRYVRRNVRQRGSVDPVDLKTLAQFLLLGDPSAHPSKGDLTGVHTSAGAGPDAQRVSARHRRRARLRKSGAEIGRKTVHADTRPERTDPDIRRRIEIGARLDHFALDSVRSFELLPPDARARKRAGRPGQSVHLVIVDRGTPKRAGRADRERRPRLLTHRLIVVRDRGGRLFDRRELHPR